MTKTLQISPKTRDILSYDSTIWRTADILRGSVTTKEHLYPNYMMPFFGLMMIESRLIREYDKALKDVNLTEEEDRIAEVKESSGFYNSMLIEEKIRLSDLVKNDKHFFGDFDRYLKSFDSKLQRLLGIVEGADTENLNISTRISDLKSKGVLLNWMALWSEVDFTAYDNSEITTLEEHIKRRWADMQAETAGQQYTPSDIGDLITELIAVAHKKTSLKFQKNKIIKIYDMTCGGGNLLFGVEDKLLSIASHIKTATYGQEMEGNLYSLAAIESMFRDDSRIERGNTLTNDRFAAEVFDFIVANPPYGVDWKDFKDAIMNDQTGRYAAGKPAVSDGQLLFLQHAIAKLNETGIGFIVLNGSPLFSGDAGSGESNIRKWILDNDYLECLIQLPTSEFFNTGITTYIWCLNKDKEIERKDKILFINAENKFVKLKKSKGSKTKEIPPIQAKAIADAYDNFSEDTDSKVLSKYNFYFNKQSLKKLEKDENGLAFKDSMTIKDDIENLTILDRLTKKTIYTLTPKSDKVNLVDFMEKQQELIKNFDNDTQQLIITRFINRAKEEYTISEDNCIIKTCNNKVENLGYGNIKIKSSLKNKEDKITLEIKIEPVWTKDDEKIEYSSIEKDNKENINNFINKWVSSQEEDYKLLENSVGVEINFNNVFPKNIKIKSVLDILAEIHNIDKELEELNVN